MTGTGAESRGPADETAGGQEAPIAQDLATGGAANDKTLLQLDADGDYLPDAFDNCPNVQNPDQADGDGDGVGDACTAQIDSDGDGRPDKGDNCPNVATVDQTDTDGDAIGDVCDKSPDGIEPTPEPVADYATGGGQGNGEPPAPENGAGQDGVEVERPGRSRSMERERTDRERATITMGVDGAEASEEIPAVDVAAEAPAVEDSYATEELTADVPLSAENETSEELYQADERAADDARASDIGAWTPVIRIDAGASEESTSVDMEALDETTAEAVGEASGRDQVSQSDPTDVADSQFARGWVRAKLLLQEAADGGAGSAADSTPKQIRGADAEVTTSVPVPVENGLVMTGRAARDESTSDAAQQEVSGADRDRTEALASAKSTRQQAGDAGSTEGAASESVANEGSRRNGSSRAAGASGSESAPVVLADDGAKQRKKRRAPNPQSAAERWSQDEYFAGGAALDWGLDLDIADTDDDTIFLTQRSGSGTGKRRGFSYAIPLEADGTYLVRLYFAEPYWGASGGPEGADGMRVFSVSGEGQRLLTDVDIFAEVGPLTALVEEVEVDVQDGELNLQFIASEGEPIVAAIEILAPGE